MSDPTVSVVIVSRDRPAALVRCLTGVAQLQYPSFEVVIVADPGGIAAAEAWDDGSAIKCVSFDEPNISAARNLGLAHAAGDIVAFIDDDAVPEPQWLRYLVAPAVRADVAAMGGFVRGRNGISFQYKSRTLDTQGMAQPLEVNPFHATVLVPPKGRGIKTEGTNMAFRREVLVELGGFDPAYHYFLDETDLNMRLGRAGYATAIVPLAEVHHGFAPSAIRRADRVPRDLFEIGASWAVFQRKHISKDARAAQWAALRQSERRRLILHMTAGRLEPRDVRRLMRRLDAGHAEGQTRSFGSAGLARHAVVPFRRFAAARRASRFTAVRGLRGKEALAQATRRAAHGTIETVLVLSRTALFHSVFFNTDGIWVQRGGIFGRSDRAAPLFRLSTFARRAERERRRVEKVRGLNVEN